MWFSILPTLVLWGLNPRHWLEAFLTACADNGGQPLQDRTSLLPWTLDDARREALQQPLPIGAPRPPDTS